MIHPRIRWSAIAAAATTLLGVMSDEKVSGLLPHEAATIVTVIGIVWAAYNKSVDKARETPPAPVGDPDLAPLAAVAVAIPRRAPRPAPIARVADPSETQIIRIADMVRAKIRAEPAPAKRRPAAKRPKGGA